MDAGIYMIFNTANSKFYIGSAVNIRSRWSAHVSKLNKNRHNNRHLQNAWNKYGSGIFRFYKIYSCDREQLIKYEQAFIDSLCPEYNLSPIAGSIFGVKYSVESCQKMSEAMKGVKRSEEARRNISLGHKNLIRTNEHCRNISEALKGRKLSEETRRKMSEAHKGHNNGVGRKVSEETRRKLSEALKNYHSKTLEKADGKL